MGSHPSDCVPPKSQGPRGAAIISLGHRGNWRWFHFVNVTFDTLNSDSHRDAFLRDDFDIISLVLC